MHHVNVLKKGTMVDHRCTPRPVSPCVPAPSGEAVSLKPLGILKVAYTGPRRRFDISARKHMVTPGYMKGNLTLAKDMKEKLRELTPSQTTVA